MRGRNFINNGRVRDSVEAKETWKVATTRQESKAKKGLSLITVPWGLSEIWKALAIEGATSHDLLTKRRAQTHTSIMINL